MGDDFGAELEDAAFFGVFFDDLNALTCGDQFPVVRVCFGVVFQQGGEALVLRNSPKRYLVRGIFAQPARSMG